MSVFSGMESQGKEGEGAAAHNPFLSLHSRDLKNLILDSFIFVLLLQFSDKR